MKVVVIAAHPDDEVLGVGGTILKHRAAGDEVAEVVAFTCRIEARPGVVWWKSEWKPSLQGNVEQAVKDYQPDIVYTHFAGDINADHRRVSEAVRVACRPYAAPSVKRLLEFYTVSSTEWGEAFKPNVYVDITDHMDGKLRALGPYVEEMRPDPHPRSANGILTAAEFFGSQAGYHYAEPFVLVRER